MARQRVRGPGRQPPSNLDDLNYWDNYHVRLRAVTGNCREVLLCVAGKCQVVTTLCPPVHPATPLIATPVVEDSNGPSSKL